MDNQTIQKDTPAWIFFTWASFGLATMMMLGGILYLPLELWIKGYFAMGFVFSVGTTFTLAKTLRDNHEARRTINRIVEAKTEKILSEYEMKSQL